VTPRRRPPPPFWFSAALLALWVLACHALDLHALETSPVSMAFFGWLIAVGQLIWSALQAVGQATLVALQWTVHALWLITKELRNGLSAFGGDLLKGFKASWQFLRTLYDDVLKPAWTKLWRLVDRLHDTLERIFRPVFRFLYQLRAELLKFYDKWVRPILDTIEVARMTLRVLSALHLEFAKRLDAKLGDLEAAIDRPFRFLLEKLNETINLVNRIVTLDGALQRLTLVRTLAKNWSTIGDEYAKWHKTPLTEEELQQLREHKYDGIDPAEPGEELRKFYSGEGGAYDGIIGELSHEWRVAAGLTSVQ
jgi:hypothetical protein